MSDHARTCTNCGHVWNYIERGSGYPEMDLLCPLCYHLKWARAFAEQRRLTLFVNVLNNQLDALKK